MFRILVVAILLNAGAGITPAKSEEHRAETDHLIITWNEGAASEADLAMAKERGDLYYAALREMLGYEPKSRVQIVLEGDAQRPDGSRGYPRVFMGRIHLYRYTPEPESYFNALAHEMVHVFRLQRAHRDWFLEEGFAEFVALRVDPSLEGFPWYGFPVHVVAGQWIAREEDIPLAVLRENHRDLNQPCKAQSYSLRSSFFKYLGDTYGDEAVLNLARQKKAGALEDYERFFEKDFEVLVGDWREALMLAYENTEDVDDLARKYRKSPVQYMKVCREGKDY